MVKLTKAAKADPEIHALSRHLVAQVPGKSWGQEVNTIFRFVRDTIRYTLDPAGWEGLQTPVQTLKMKSGDCDDQAMLVAALLESIGHKCRFVAVKVDNSPQYCHVFAQTKIGPNWITLETTEPWEMGSISPRITGKAMVRHI